MKTLVFAVVMVWAITPTPLRAQLPLITNQPASRALWAGGNVTFSAGVSNSAAFTHQWQFNSTNLPDGIITTVAGNGVQASSGDGSLAVNASIYGADDVALDPVGNMYIVDYMGAKLRKVDTNGIITTVAGNGAASCEQTNGPATNASFIYPEGTAMDSAGNLFIAGFECGLVQKVDTNGFISTVAGNLDYANGIGDGNAATNSRLSSPASVNFDEAGNMYIAAGGQNRIRKVDTNGIITTVAGNGTRTFSGDDGAATNASLSQPEDAVVDSQGNLYIADFANSRVRKVDTNGIITTFAGSRSSGYAGDGDSATNASLSLPYGVTLDACGDLFIVDEGDSCVRKVDANGVIATVAGNGTYGFSGDGGFATNATFELPMRMAVDRFGNWFIADSYNCRVRKVTNTKGPVLALNAVTPANAGIYQPVATGPDGSVTSSVVNLIVATGPLIYQTARHSDGSVALSFVSQPGSTNLVLCATSLAPPIGWQSLSTNVAGPDGDWCFTDTNAVAVQARFYRSLQQ